MGKGSSREGVFEPSKIEAQLMGKGMAKHSKEECFWGRRRNIILDIGGKKPGCGYRMFVGVEDRV